MRNRITKVRGCELDPNMTTENQILRLTAYINQLVTTMQLKEEGATGTSKKKSAGHELKRSSRHTGGSLTLESSQPYSSSQVARKQKIILSRNLDFHASVIFIVEDLSSSW